jgi:Domain of unknown function (DUF397)
MIAWRKSSFSEGGGATDCVELADLDQLVGIRDSKSPERGHLSVSRTALSGLLHRIKNGEL